MCMVATLLAVQPSPLCMKGASGVSYGMPLPHELHLAVPDLHGRPDVPPLAGWLCALTGACIPYAPWASPETQRDSTTLPALHLPQGPSNPQAGGQPLVTLQHGVRLA